MENTNISNEENVVKSIENHLQKCNDLSKKVNKEIFVEIKEEINKIKGSENNGGPQN